MMKVFAFVFCVVALCAVAFGAISYEVTGDSLVISGSGNIGPYYGYSAAPWHSAAQSCTSIVIESGVESIGDYAFSGLPSVNSITVPNTVRSVGSYAFSGCTSLTQFSASSSTTFYVGPNAFKGSSFKEISIGGSSISLSYASFASASSLETISFDGNVTTVGYGSFYECKNLESISFTSVGTFQYFLFCAPDNVPSTYTFCTERVHSITVSGDVETINGYAFYRSSNLSSFVVGGSIRTIKCNAFSLCDKLATLRFGSVGLFESGFVSSSRAGGNLSIVVDDSVEKIGDFALESTAMLSAFTAGGSVGYIGIEAFSKAVGLSKFSVGGRVGKIEDEAFMSCTSLKEVSFGEVNGSIPQKAFYMCSSLNSLSIPGAKSIGQQAFYKNGLTSLTIPSSVESIGYDAFGSSLSLVELIIPASVTSISSSAFSSSSELVNVEYLGNQDPGPDSDAFYSCSKLDAVLVPETYTSTTFCGVKVKVPISSSSAPSGKSSGESSSSPSPAGSSSTGKSSSSPASTTPISDVSTASILGDGVTYFIVPLMALMTVLLAQ